MLKNLLKLIFWLAVCFCILTLGRFIYLAANAGGGTPIPYSQEKSVHYNAQVMQSNDNASISSYGMSGMRNFTKVKVQQAPSSTQYSVQTYEKIASMYNATKDFDKDDQKLRGIIKEQEAVVQKEQSSGLPGSRNTEMSIGVVPDKFDTAVEKLKKIGKITSFSATKTDKTGEYAELKAKKAALEETKKSLMSLKSRNGKIDELINLENRIYELNKEMQGLGLQIGEFESVTDFCTVRITLQEEGKTNIPWVFYFFDAMGWALLKELIILVIIFFGMLAVWIALKVVEKAREVNKLVEAMAKKKK
jgi:hypothetical protein